VTAGDDGTARVWDVAGGRLLHVLVGHRSAVRSLALCPGEETAITGGDDGTVRRWDLGSGRPLAVLSGHLDSVWSVACGRVAVSGSLDDTARVWDVGDRQIVRELALGRGALVSDPSRDGRSLVVTFVDGTATTWDLASGLRTGEVARDGEIAIARFMPDARHVLTADRERGSARVVDVATGRVVQSFTGHDGEVGNADVSADGRRVVTSGLDGTAIVWDSASGKELATVRHPPRVLCPAFSPDGRLIVTAGQDRTARVWDADTGAARATLSGHTSFVLTAFFDPEGRRIVTASADKTVRVWDAATGAQVRLLEGHTDDPITAIFAGGSDLVVSGGRGGTVNVWSATTGRLLQVRRPHTGSVGNVAALAGNVIATTGEADGKVYLWDVSIDRRQPAGIRDEIACRVGLVVAGGQLTRRHGACTR
jgi:WD40 repeat protein